MLFSHSSVDKGHGYPPTREKGVFSWIFIEVVQWYCAWHDINAMRQYW